MAERQEEFTYTPNILNSIEKSLSAPRLNAYLLRSAGDPVYALDLYLFNARLAKSLLFPLHVAEVTVRNAVNEVLTKEFGVNWANNGSPFRLSVPSPNPIAALDKAIERLQFDGVRRPTTDQIVATLTFDFWSNLFRSDYDRFIWQTNIHVAFPNLPQTQGRPEVQTLARNINRLRNRVAHHEPLLNKNSLPGGLDIHAQLQQIIELISLRCKETSAWAKAHSTVGRILRDKPTKGAARPGQPAIDRAIRRFPILRLKDTLTEALAEVSKHDHGVAVVELDEEATPFSIITSGDLTRWFASSHVDSYVCLNDGKVEDVLQEASPRTVLLKDHSITTPEVTALMYEQGKSSKQRPSVVVLTEGIPPRPIGIILRPVTRLS